MFCASCSLHYPDHLNFCRRCGQPLVHSASEKTADSQCCTRCGARTVRGEKFCQQCGNPTTGPMQETIVGACYHCGTSWRNGWLFCKMCGLDIDRALLPSNSSTGAPAIRAAAEELPAVEKVYCKRCGSAAKPYSRFCETCGNRIDLQQDVPITGKLKTPPAAAALRTQIDNPPPPSSRRFAEAEEEREFDPLRTLDPLDSPPRRTLDMGGEEPPRVEPRFAPAEPLPPPPSEEDAAARRSSPPPPRIVRWPSSDSERRRTSSFHDGPTGPMDSGPLSDLGGEGHGRPRTSTVVTAIPGGPKKTVKDRWRRFANVTRGGGATGGLRARGPAPRMPRIPSPFRHSPIEPAGWTQEPPRSKWPGIAMGAIILLTIATIVWGLKIRNARLTGLSDHTIFPGILAPSSPAAGGKPTPEAASPSPSLPAVKAPLGMVYIPGGEFEMGRTGGDEAEAPAHKVTVAPFFMDQTEVTNDDYMRFVVATARPAPSDWIDGKIPLGAGRLPVVNVTWEDAMAYAQWCNKRLPSEAEWEFAARGADKRLYPWGNEWNRAFANAGNGDAGHIVEVGGYQSGASPFKVLDMCGNVWEWTASRLTSYTDNSEIAPGRVVRGGAFNANERTATTTYRGVLQPDRAYPRTGFRCVRDAR